MRFDLYSLIHKGQRKYLFDLSSDIGRTNASDIKQCQDIAKRVHEMACLIEDHRENEETFIHPLFAEVGMLDTVLDAEHDKLKEKLELLKELSAENNINTLYKEFNIFLAEYLLHTDEEEKQQELVLWKHFDDERLMSVMRSFAGSKTSEEMIAGFELMAPALNIEELRRIFARA
jgi:uncharacterized UPF0160 family protein